MSLERLIKLAQKTGDRLIVHDEFSGRDVVILDVDSYERLFDLSTFNEPFDDGMEDPWNSFEDDDESDEDNFLSEDRWNSVGDVIADVAPVPQASVDTSSAHVWPEDPLPDEPVFYEEPV